MCSSHRPRGDRSLPRGNLETGDGPNERVARLAEGTQRRRVSDARCLIVLRSAVTAVSARAGQKSTQCFAGRSSIESLTVGNACRHIRSIWPTSATCTKSAAALPTDGLAALW